MRFLIFGDVVGRIGREAISEALPNMRNELAIDSVIINIENIAHGKGISAKTVSEALAWDADTFTTGDHAWDNTEGIPLLKNPRMPIIRPANYPKGAPGRGWHVFTSGAWHIAVINLQGQLGFRNAPDNPFIMLDDLLAVPEIQQAHIKLIDFHAELTSEKRAFGWHADGKVTAVWGTHTHIPTADAQILPRGTGYISDVGMNGGYHSVLGMEKEVPIRVFRTQIKEKLSPPESGPKEINALLLDIDPAKGITRDIAHVRKILNDKRIEATL